MIYLAGAAYWLAGVTVLCWDDCRNSGYVTWGDILGNALALWAFWPLIAVLRIADWFESSRVLNTTAFRCGRDDV